MSRWWRWFWTGFATGSILGVILTLAIRGHTQTPVELLCIGVLLAGLAVTIWLFVRIVRRE